MAPKNQSFTEFERSMDARLLVNERPAVALMLGRKPANWAFTLAAWERISWRCALSEGFLATATRIDWSVSILRGL